MKAKTEPGMFERYLRAFLQVGVTVLCFWTVAGIIAVLMHTAGAF